MGMDLWCKQFFQHSPFFFSPKGCCYFHVPFASFLVKEARLTSSHQVVFEAFWSLFFGKKVWLFYTRPQKHIKIKVLLLYDNNWILFFLCGAHWNVSFFSWRDQDKSWFVIKPMLMIFLKQSRVLIWSPLHYVLGDLCGSHSADVYWLRLNQVGLTMAHIKIALGGTFEHVENATIFDF